MPNAHAAGQDRRPVRRKGRSASSPLPWIIAAVVVIGAGAFWMFGRNQQQVSASDLSVIRDRTEIIFAAMRDVKPAPSFNKSGFRLFSPTGWFIANVEAEGTRGRAVANVDSANAGGIPVKMTWELRFSRYAGDGWTCTDIVLTTDGYDPQGWKK